MKKIVPVCLVLFLLSSCSPKQEKVERFMENGVEVVVNHLEPYKIKGEPTSLKLEEEFTIDTEKDDVAEKGLSDIAAFDADSEGSIYFLDSKSKDYFIFKFDNHGKFISSLARKGQGPGELQIPRFFMIDDQDQLTITDIAKLILLRKDGNLLQEIPLYFLKKGMVRIGAVCHLGNRNYLIKREIFNPKGDNIWEYPLSLRDPEFKELKELARHQIPNAERQIGKKLSFFILSWRVSNKKYTLPPMSLIMRFTFMIWKDICFKKSGKNSGLSIAKNFGSDSKI